MRSFPDAPDVADAPDRLVERGHLWLLEWVDGAPLRFQVRASGLLRFGDRECVYDDPDAVPAPYGAAVRHVRERLDRDALRDAVDDVESVCFFGVATVRRRVDYDWERTPPFLGVDVWSGEREAFLPPDAVAGIYERLGLAPANAVERELPARDFDPDAYEVPASAWYDGPAAGVLVRNKRGGRALLQNDGAGSPQEDVAASAADLAERIATPERLERRTSDLDDGGRAVTAEALAERVVEDAVREAWPAFERGAVERAALRSAVAERVRAFLDERPDDAW